jgi:ribonuclease M5
LNQPQKLHITQAVIVEGKYDKIKLDAVVDGLILTTDGFGVFRDAELKAFIKRLARERGLVILTDSDVAGFRIRAYLTGMIPAERITNVFIPELSGKERRKRRPSAEGKLGVEGMDAATLREAFARAGILADAAPPHREDPITRLDLYEDGLTGGPESRALRAALYKRLSLPLRLNITATLPLLNNILTRDEYKSLVLEISSQSIG